MIIRKGTSADFNHLETFVWQAIFPAFDVEGLTAEQRAENDALVEDARNSVISAVDHDEMEVLIAYDPQQRRLAGYVIADKRPRSYASIDLIIVKKAYWGKGVAQQLLDAALVLIGDHRSVSLEVRHYNDRAKAFFAKYGFIDSGETSGDHAIPRSLLVKEKVEAEPVVEPVQEKTVAKTSKPKPVAGTSLESLNFSAAPLPEVRQDDFPTLANEPVFEDLPDFNLATDAEPIFTTGTNALATAAVDTPLFEETNLDDETITQLEAFIARAKAKKAGQPVEKIAPVPPQKSSPAPPATAPANTKVNLDPTPVLDRPLASEADETFEDGEEVPTATTVLSEPSFEFGFSEPTAEPDDSDVDEFAIVSPGVKMELEIEEIATSTAEPEAPAEASSVNNFCPNCGTALPPSAKFCFNCGTPQTVETSAVAPSQLDPLEHPGTSAVGAAIEWEVTSGEVNKESSVEQKLPPIPETALSLEPAVDDLGDAEPEEERIVDDGNDEAGAIQSAFTKRSAFTTAGLKEDFRRLLEDRVNRYFGERRLAAYFTRLQNDREFQLLRDSTLSNLKSWLDDQHGGADVSKRILDTQEDLVEYFLVESARDLHRSAFPQKLLRYQSLDWQQVDLFQLVMDYLNFGEESEQIHTDFVQMPARALKNATASFLQAAKDERIFFICDQSLISQAKNGFAMTDSAIYWKNIFQPPGQAFYKNMRAPRIEGGHLVVDEKYFDAGSRLNLKIALLLDKLRRAY
ncbi:GNAT family N-acetyltransferase [Lewinella sp. 4G2]|uniref:GNAT family N-acetyltransferase n=1 Tax=Lewinella sp. 4G2 TaxID=1803372 RepID=UPI0007B4ED17|nr:GNAT family N-acetyltransferase [Lewinella sp. 4G2]OAV45507.1 hypothetical protein A3850_013860 [Lewinella sp. 4G2]